MSSDGSYESESSGSKLIWKLEGGRGDGDFRINTMESLILAQDER